MCHLKRNKKEMKIKVNYSTRLHTPKCDLCVLPGGGGGGEPGGGAQAQTPRDLIKMDNGLSSDENETKDDIMNSLNVW